MSALERHEAPRSRVGAITPTYDRTRAAGYPAPVRRLTELSPRSTPRKSPLSRHASLRPIRPGEVLVGAGDRNLPFFVVTAG